VSVSEIAQLEGKADNKQLNKIWLTFSGRTKALIGLFLVTLSILCLSNLKPEQDPLKGTGSPDGLIFV
jgi:hypothetical protein